ncbi:GLPGLI family protein [uncultured Tenacibaculum sp.]|uniref:GLPGLI family protein n=1 Tax=uncultured Tenacibaculum sp. TaxID=174713 RepID=UPI002605D7C9|nr:GLPGLI family protein [uncultured Tenacibaculum sp.]
MVKYIFFLAVSVAFGQKVNKATYEIILNKPEKTTKVKNIRAQLLIEDAKNVEYEMLFNLVESYYFEKEVLKNDFEKGINLTKVLAGNNNKYYTSYGKEQNCFYLNETEGDNLFVSYKKVVWKLLQESKKIGDLLCYKAETLNINKSKKFRPTVAWYAPEIPYSFGPNKYHGLPGLIVQLNNNTLTYNLKKIEFSISDKIKKPKKGKRITEEEFLKEFYKKYSDKK